MKTSRSFLSSIAAALALSLLSFSGANALGTTAAAIPITSAEQMQMVGGEPVHVWKPATSPRAIVVMVHGITASAHCLTNLANALVADNVMVYGIDLRGHGWWWEHSHDSQKCNYSATVQDAENLISSLRTQYRNIPLFVAGESVGAAVALRCAVESAPQLDGVILCAAGDRCARAKTSWVIGDLCRAITGRKISLKRYQEKYGTEDKMALSAMMQAPDLRSVFSAKELLGTMHFIRGNAKIAKKLDPTMPVLMIQGAADQTLKPKSAEDVFSALPTPDKSMVVVPNCGHVLLATTRLKSLVKDSILGFVNEKSSARAIAARRAQMHVNAYM